MQYGSFGSSACKQPEYTAVFANGRVLCAPCRLLLSAVWPTETAKALLRRNEWAESMVLFAGYFYL